MHVLIKLQAGIYKEMCVSNPHSHGVGDSETSLLTFLFLPVGGVAGYYITLRCNIFIILRYIQTTAKIWIWPYKPLRKWWLFPSIVANLTVGHFQCSIVFHWTSATLWLYKHCTENFSSYMSLFFLPTCTDKIPPVHLHISFPLWQAVWVICADDTVTLYSPVPSRKIHGSHGRWRVTITQTTMNIPNAVSCISNVLCFPSS